MTTVTCPYCNSPADLVYGGKLYPHAYNLYHKQFYHCEPCKAWVGCHDGTETPLGRLANAELRAAKSRAHIAFDALWRAKMNRDGINQSAARGAGYKWLAKQLGMDRANCHIGMFDVETCSRVVLICEPYHAKGAANV